MGSRIKNSASIDMYVKVIRSNLPAFGQDYLKPSLDQVAADYYDFLDELLDKTPRPTKDLLFKGCKTVHPEAAAEDINAWANKMLEVLVHLRGKAKTSTSMVRINPKIKLLVKKLKKMKQCDLSPSPEQDRCPGSTKGSLTSRSSSGVSLDNDNPSTSLSSKASKHEVYAAYGITNVPKMLATDVIEITESQEEPLLESKQTKAGEISLQWYDAAANCLKRKLKDGTQMKAFMSEGKNGFLMATFLDEDPIETEVPNMVLLPTVMKRPSCRKKPAAYKRPSKKAKTTHDDGEEEDDRDEDAEHDDDDDDDDNASAPVEQGACEDEDTEQPHISSHASVVPNSKCFFEYSNPYFYPNGTCAIRRKGSVSTKQVASIKCNLPKKRLHEIMSKLTKLLNNGEVAEAEIKDWLKANVK